MLSLQLPGKSKRAVAFYPSVGSHEPYLHPHSTPSIHFISFHFISFHFSSSFSSRSRGERCEAVVEPGAALHRLLDKLLSVGLWIRQPSSSACGQLQERRRGSTSRRAAARAELPSERRRGPTSQAVELHGEHRRDGPGEDRWILRRDFFIFCSYFFEFLFVFLLKFFIHFVSKIRFSKSLCKYFNQKFPLCLLINFFRKFFL
jgi:hypothetical protein